METGSRAPPVTGLDPLAPASSASRSAGNAVPQPEVAPTSIPATERQTEGQVPSSDSGFDSPPRNSGLSYPELAKKIADAHSLREQADAIRPGAPRTKRLTSTSAKSAVEAAYLETWRQKTERIGRANYPPGGLSGELLLLAIIHRNGNLEEVRVSGIFRIRRARRGGPAHRSPGGALHPLSPRKCASPTIGWRSSVDGAFEREGGGASVALRQGSPGRSPRRTPARRPEFASRRQRLFTPLPEAAKINNRTRRSVSWT